VIRLERRLTAPRWLSWAVPLGSIVAALLAGAILIFVSGNDVVDTYSRIVDRAFGSADAWSATFIAATPLLFTGLAAAIAFRMGVFNIGGEGQFVMGAIAGSWVGLVLGDELGKAVIPLMIVAGIAAGAVWAGIVGVLKTRFNTNEIITSLMLNYVAINIAYYLIFNSRSTWRLLTGGGAQFPQGKPLPDSAFWPALTIAGIDIPLGFVLGAVCALGLWALYRTTRFGFEVNVIADAPDAARYAGMRTRRKVLAVLALSGAAAGLGGVADVGDVRHILDPKGLSQVGYGYTGIVVAALARLNPIAVVFVSLLIGGLNNAGRSLQGPDFPAGLVGTLQGLILFFTVGGEVLARYRIRWRRSSAVPA
jgi:simple sugar transport system permease protein